MKYIVEVRYTGVDWGDLMADNDMRSWLDRRQIKVEEFSHTLLARGVAVRVGFYNEDYAAAFATSFSGRLQSAEPYRAAVQKMMSRPAESDPDPRFPKGLTSLGISCRSVLSPPQGYLSPGSL